MRFKSLRPLFVLGVSCLIAAPLAAQQDGEAHFNVAVTHLREGRASLALEEFKKAIRQDPRNAYFHKGLGVCYMRMGRFPEAVEALRKTLQLNPYYIDARNDLGTALIYAGKREEGKRELLAAFNEPTNPTPELSAYNIGQAYFEEKQYVEAANWFGSSASRNKALVRAHTGLADSLLALGRLDEAIRGLEEAVKAVPSEASLLLRLGDAYYRAGRFNEARTRLQEAQARDGAGEVGRRAAELLKQFAK